MNLEHLTTTHYIHIIAFIALFLIAAVRSRTLFKNISADGQPCQNNRSVFVALQHLSLTVIGITGILMLYHHDFVVQSWFYAKITLFAVMLSSLIKAFKKPNVNITLQQRKAGLILALFCYITILIFIFVKAYS